MKRLISLLMALVMVLSLCACGGGNAGGNNEGGNAGNNQSGGADLTAFVGKWINLCAGEEDYLDYLVLNEDGTAAVSFRGIEFGREISATWEAQDEKTVAVTTDSFLGTINFALNPEGKLEWRNNVCVREADYETVKADLIAEMVANSDVIDLKEFMNAAWSNPLKVENDYKGKFVIAVGYAYNISDVSLNLSYRQVSGSSIPSESMIVYLKPADLMTVEQGQLVGTVTSVTFKGMQYDIIVDFKGFKWLIQTTDHSPEGARIGIKIDPDGIHIMKKSHYSGMFGDYSSFSEEYDELDVPVVDPEEEESDDEE